MGEMILAIRRLDREGLNATEIAKTLNVSLVYVLEVLG